MLTYLASPYYHSDQQVVDFRMKTFYETDAYLSRCEGLHIFSPLYKVETAKYGLIPDTFEFWEKYCYEILSRCDEMIVITVDGWDTSTGVNAEIVYCTQHNIPIRFFDPVSCTFTTRVAVG